MLNTPNALHWKQRSPFRRVLPVLFLLIPSALYAQKSYYEPTDEFEKPGCTVSNQLEIDPKASLQDKLHQGHTGTCYGHAAYSLLQYFYSIDQLYGQKASELNSLALLDVLGKGSHGILRSGGMPSSILHHLKNQSIYLNTNYNIDQVFELSEQVRTKPKLDVNILKSRFLGTFNLTPDDLLEHWEQLFEKRLSQDRRKIAHALLFEGLKVKPLQTILPPYNVEVFELPNETLKQINASHPDVTPEAIVQFKMRSLLEPIAPHQKSYPVVLTFCPHEWDLTGCSGQHAVTVTGVRTLCRSGAFFFRGKCIEEWKLSNSYGGKREGWHKAGPLIQSFLKYKTHIASIKPCGLTPETPPCHSHIESHYPLHYLAHAGDLETVQELLDRATPSLDVNARDQMGFTPLHAAVAAGHIPMAQFLIQRGADIEARNSRGYTPFAIATYHGELEMIEFLISQEVNPLVTTNYNLTLLDIAFQQSHEHNDPRIKETLLRYVSAFKEKHKKTRRFFFW